MNECLFVKDKQTYRKNIVSNIDSPDMTIRLKYSAEYCPIVKEK